MAALYLIGITTLFSKDNNGTTDTTMEILATDGHDVVSGVTSLLALQTASMLS